MSDEKTKKDVEEKETKEDETTESKEFLKLKASADIIKTVVEAMHVVGKETIFDVKRSGITSRIVDEAHVVMNDIEISPKCCEEFSSGACELGIDIVKLDQLLKLASSNDVIELSYDKNNGNVLIVKFGNLVRRIALIDTAGMPRPKIPNLNFMVEAEMPADMFKRSMKACDQVNDFFTLITNEDNVVISAEDSNDKVDVKLIEEEGQLSKLNVKDKAKSNYSIDYMNDIVKAAKSDTTLNFKYASDNPIHLDYGFYDGGVKVKYLVAPRIESED